MKKAPGRRIAVALLLLVAVGAFIFVTLNKPGIVSIDPTSFTEGEPVFIHGTNFGDERKKGRILLDSMPLTQSSYVSWTANEIGVILPSTLDSGLLQVVTIFGKSNPDIVIRQAGLPQKSSNAVQAAAGPSILAIRPPEAAVGSLVTIEGINFGSNVQFSDVGFSRNTGYIEPEDPGLMYESWDDKRISVRVPEGAGSGTVVVKTPQGESAPFSFDVRKGTGAKYLFDPVVYSLQFKVRIRKKDPRKQGTIALYLPLPLTSLSQRLDSIQEESPAAYIADYGKVAAFKISDFQGSEAVVSRTALVTVNRVETELVTYSDGFEKGIVPPFLQPFLMEDALVPARAKEIAGILPKLMGKEKNLQKKALLLQHWLTKNLAWKPNPAARETALSALKAGKAGSQSFALLACAFFRAAGVPAVPLSGFLVRKDSVSIPHFWLEYYLPSVGWIPYDPVLALGAKPSGFDAALDLPEHYFGSLDNRHISLSRGITTVAPLLGGSAAQASKVPWSFQTLFEESSGASYTSTWQDIEIVGTY
ncbi:MAG: transglutaminase domain-containing protein [Rectinemataceae bacterium]|nr:transglutaminase domain-containing protein [Rectinemataceae bacterium]